MKTVFLLVAVLFTKMAIAQNKPASIALPDINKMMSMSPAEIEAYKKQMLNDASKQAKQIAEQNNFKIDEMSLPDFELKLPVKNVKRLALLSAQPPTMEQMIDELKKSKQLIESVTPKAILEQVNTLVIQQTPAQLQSASIEAFYNDKPLNALLLSIQSALKNSSEAIAWNNLSAMYNMTGLQHKAIPILMHHLQNQPNNPMLLNNMGQAYFGLGEISNAKIYLQKCLAADSLHPEANRSMGIICLLQKNQEEAEAHFKKEVEVTVRESTTAMMEKYGLTINVFKAHDTNIPNRDYFGAIQLGKFKLPEFPKTTGQTKIAREKHSQIMTSVTSELVFWLQEAQGSPENFAMEGKQTPGLYAKKVERLLDDLHKIYTPYELSILNDININQLKKMGNEYAQQMAELHCPSPPAGASGEMMIAYQKKCCDLKKPVMEKYMAGVNDLVMQRFYFISGTWKQYINKLINIVSLNPTPANRRYVSGVVYQYFVFLGNASQAGVFLDPPTECRGNMTSAEADSIIASSRKVDLLCPDNLKLNLKLKVVTIKADCSNYSISGSHGIFKADYSHSFKTGTSTLSAGAGLEAKFYKDLGKASVSQMVYVSWDNNNTFTDIGLKGGAGINIDGGIAGVEAEYTLGVNAGWQGSVTPKGVIAKVVEIVK